MNLRRIHTDEIIKAISSLCLRANQTLPRDVSVLLKKALRIEDSGTGKAIIRDLIENMKIARYERSPLCQDTGVTVVYLKIGQDVKIIGKSLLGAVNIGVRHGYRYGYLRASLVKDPFSRSNTMDNTPAIVFTDIVRGNRIEITMVPRGAGGENMSTVRMFPPSFGRRDIMDFIVDWVKDNAVNSCPPLVIGIGIGGSFENVAILSFKALIRPLNRKNPDSFYACMEKELKGRINRIGIGPQGLGGKVTALGVNIESDACHMASLPVAVNMSCHSLRRCSIVI